jgi:ribosome-binding factor A
VRRRIGAELQLRVVPEVVFVLDKGSEHAAHIARLLAGIDKPAPDAVDDDDEESES